ncbi:MAG: ABC transporter substrate-binding protein [Spirochaetota bacterium]
MRHAARLVLALLLVAGLVATGAFAGGQQEGRQDREREAADVEAAAPTDNPWTDGEDLSGTEVNIFGAFVEPGSEHFDDAMDHFEEQTGITVNYEGSGDFESLITVRAEGGDPPDIAAFPQPGLLQDFAERDLLIDLNDWFDRSYLEEQYDESWLEIATMDGIMAGVWYRANIKSLVWYPKPEFSEAGYEVPETWDEMIELSDQMVEDGNIPWSIGIEASGSTGWVATDWMEDIMLRTVTPEKYDEWVAGELPFSSSEVQRAAEIMGEIWFNEDYVLGGTNSILTVPFGDAANPLFEDPPEAWLHRQASFITDFFPDDVEVGEDVDFFYLPMIDEEQGEPVLGAGDIFGAFNDRPEVRAVMRYLTEGRSVKDWIESGGVVSPHNDADLDWYPTEANRRYAEILMDADTFRFDASDMMPGRVGAGAFWEQMTNWIQQGGEDAEQTLGRIDQAWAEGE